ncbi:MAG: recombination mediator RecR [Arachnia propionica]|nr:recombination mediator RecR [Arachnia propionica]
MYEGPIQDLIDELSRLPGIGPRGAQRIAFHLLDAPEEDVFQLADVLRRVKQAAQFCEVCFNITQETRCRICRDPRRDPSVLCVVEESKDVVAIERTGEFRGLYHVLGGAISPIDGRGPGDLHTRELFQRLADGAVTEVILATDPDTQGEATASYLSRMLRDFGVSVTRPASGLPVGGDLEYADQVTLGRAFEGRRSMFGEALEPAVPPPPVPVEPIPPTPETSPSAFASVIR